VRFVTAGDEERERQQRVGFCLAAPRDLLKHAEGHAPLSIAGQIGWPTTDIAGPEQIAGLPLFGIVQLGLHALERPRDAFCKCLKVGVDELDNGGLRLDDEPSLIGLGLVAHLFDGGQSDRRAGASACLCYHRPRLRP